MTDAFEFVERCEQFEMLLQVSKRIFPGPLTPAKVAGEISGRVTRLLRQLEDELADVTSNPHPHHYPAVEPTWSISVRASLPKNRAEADVRERSEHRLEEAERFLRIHKE